MDILAAMHPRLRFAMFLLGAALLMVLAVGLQLFLAKAPMLSVEGTLVQVDEHAGHRDRGTNLVVLRADGRRQLLTAGGLDPHFAAGQRVHIEEQANVVRKCAFLDASGVEQARYDDKPFSPLWLFGPCSLILAWLGWRGYRQSGAKEAVAG